MPSSDLFFGHVIDDSIINGISPTTELIDQNKNLRISFVVYTSSGMITILSKKIITIADKTSWIDNYKQAYRYVVELLNRGI